MPVLWLQCPLYSHSHTAAQYPPSGVHCSLFVLANYKLKVVGGKLAPECPQSTSGLQMRPTACGLCHTCFVLPALCSRHVHDLDRGGPQLGVPVESKYII